MSIEASKKKPPKGRLRRSVELSLAIALIVSGTLFLIAWEHPLSVIWTDPVAIFWDTHTRVHDIGGRLWFMGPTLIAAGAFWIAEDWFGFGQSDYSTNSASKDGKPLAALGYDRDPRGLPPSST